MDPSNPGVDPSGPGVVALASPSSSSSSSVSSSVIPADRLCCEATQMLAMAQHKVGVAGHFQG